MHTLSTRCEFASKFVTAGLFRYADVLETATTFAFRGKPPAYCTQFRRVHTPRSGSTQQAVAAINDSTVQLTLVPLWRHTATGVESGPLPVAVKARSVRWWEEQWKTL